MKAYAIVKINTDKGYCWEAHRDSCLLWLFGAGILTYVTGTRSFVTGGDCELRLEAMSGSSKKVVRKVRFSR